MAASATLAASVLGASQALAWGDSGHRLIGRLGVETLPEELPGFLRTKQAAEDVGEFAREPDRSRGAGKVHDTDRDPGHFVDVDDDGKVLGGPALDDLPPTREDYESALRAVGTDTAKAGYLPYAIVDGFQQLAKDFACWRAAVIGEQREKDDVRRAWIIGDRIRRERLVLRDLGVWAHYVGDGSQPLHVTVHFNGWGQGPNPDGYTTERIHVPFEGPYVSANVTEDEVRAAMAPSQACKRPIEHCVAEYLKGAYATVIPFYELEKAGGLKPGDPRGPAFAAGRLAAGASELRDLVVDAWRASAFQTVGYPAASLKDLQSGRADAYAQLHGLDP
jgi:hypothetical protein